MKKQQENMKSKPLISAAYLSVIAMIIIISFYYAFLSPNIQFSPPSQSSMNYEDAHSVISKLGNEGIEWYCGKKELYKDDLGNTYGQVELNELKKIVGNEDKLREEFC